MESWHLILGLFLFKMALHINLIVFYIMLQVGMWDYSGGSYTPTLMVLLGSLVIISRARRPGWRRSVEDCLRCGHMISGPGLFCMSPFLVLIISFDLLFWYKNETESKLITHNGPSTDLFILFPIIYRVVTKEGILGRKTSWEICKKTRTWLFKLYHYWLDCSALWDYCTIYIGLSRLVYYEHM